MVLQEDLHASGPRRGFDGPGAEPAGGPGGEGPGAGALGFDRKTPGRIGPGRVGRRLDADHGMGDGPPLVAHDARDRVDALRRGRGRPRPCEHNNDDAPDRSHLHDESKRLQAMCHGSSGIALASTGLGRTRRCLHAFRTHRWRISPRSSSASPQRGIASHPRLTRALRGEQRPVLLSTRRHRPDAGERVPAAGGSVLRRSRGGAALLSRGGCSPTGTARQRGRPSPAGTSGQRARPSPASYGTSSAAASHGTSSAAGGAPTSSGGGGLLLSARRGLPRTAHGVRRGAGSLLPGCGIGCTRMRSRALRAASRRAGLLLRPRRGLPRAAAGLRGRGWGLLPGPGVGGARVRSPALWSA